MLNKSNTINTFKFLILILISLLPFTSFATGGGGGGPDVFCEDAMPFCTDESYNFTNETFTTAPQGPNYGTCAAIANGLDNPAWYYMEIAVGGTLQIHLHQTSGPNQTGTDLDLDFVMWGPYPSIEEACNLIMAGSPPIQVSFDPSGEEDIGIGLQGGTDTWCAGSPYGPTTPPPAQVGEIYVVMITNPSGQAGYVSFSQTGGTGSADCAIVTPCSIESFNLNVTECDNNNQYAISGTIVASGLPETGDLIVEDCNGNTLVVASAPFTGTSFPYNFTGLNGDGEECSLKVYFEDDPGCYKLENFTAPDCTSPCDNPVIDALNVTHPSCNGECDGAISVVVSGGEAPYSYQWFDANNDLINSTLDEISSLCEGDYSVVVTDALGCSASESASLVSPSEDDASFDLMDYCEGEANQATNVVTPGGTFSFNPEPNDGATINSTTGGISNGVGGTTYTVEYTTAGDCSSSSTENVTVNAIPDVSLTANPTTGTPPLTVDFENTSSGQADYIWDFGIGGPSEDDGSFFTEIYSEAGTYHVVLTAVSDAGCSDTAQVEIYVVYPDMQYTFPNVFTPNGDNQNDEYKLINPQSISELEIIILNRWGVVVYEADEVNFKWNGKVKNSGSDCDDGTYFYKATLTGLDGEEKKEHGFLHLNREK